VSPPHKRARLKLPIRRRACTSPSLLTAPVMFHHFQTTMRTARSSRATLGRRENPCTSIQPQATVEESANGFPYQRTDHATRFPYEYSHSSQTFSSRTFLPTDVRRTHVDASIRFYSYSLLHFIDPGRSPYPSACQDSQCTTQSLM
jgi:hypothetical protein